MSSNQIGYETICRGCEFCKEEEGVPFLQCRSVREHPALNHLSNTQRAQLDLLLSVGEKFPYNGSNGEPPIIFKVPDELKDEWAWPTSFDPYWIEKCDLFIPKSITFEKVK